MMNDMAKTTDNDEAERVRGLLRSVPYPGFTRDIVAAGFVKGIEAEGGRVTVHFTPNTSNQAKVEQMEAGIHDVLAAAGGFESVEIERHQAAAEASMLMSSGGGITPLQAEMINDGVAAEADVIGRSKQLPNMAPQAGYNEDGPTPLGGPRGDTYEGEIPVFQWQIDPHDSAAKSGTANLNINDWEFRVWWQVHPERLVYASIQAMQEDWVEHDGKARSH
ncbi:MAG TPA: DUF59 domain-containing protein, partial [Rhodospirillales bacterium]|nr:DUF59 domain-containing protein [Rhodospirillales bacterium]